MAVSRLNEIQTANNPFHGGGARVQQSRPKPKSAFAEFKQQQDKINLGCDKIARATRDIKDLIERYSRATKSSEEEEISAELDNIVQATGKVAKDCKANIQRLNDDLKTNSSQYPEGSNERASRKQGIKASATKFIKRVKDYQAAQELFKVNMKETLTRRVRIIAPDKDEAEIDKIIDDGEAGKIFQQVILQGKGRLADTYRDVMDTHKVSNYMFRYLVKPFFPQFFFFFCLLISVYTYIDIMWPYSVYAIHQDKPLWCRGRTHTHTQQ